MNSNPFLKTTTKNTLDSSRVFEEYIHKIQLIYGEKIFFQIFV